MLCNLLYVAVILTLPHIHVRGDTCESTVTDSVATGLHTELQKYLDISTDVINLFIDTVGYMGINSEPQVIDDTDPPIQRTVYDSVLNLVDSHYLGYESGGEFVGYFASDSQLIWRSAGAYDANAEQASIWTYDGANGDSTGSAPVSSFAYDPRIRPWYIDAKAACEADLSGQFTCAKVWSDWYVFADSGLLGITPCKGFTSDNGTSIMGVAAMDFTTVDISEMFSSAVSGSTHNEVAYMMEMDGTLIATSNGAAVVNSDGETRTNAKQSSDAQISTSATYILDNNYVSDQTLKYNDEYVTVKNFVVDSLHWYIVVVADAISDDDCEYELELDTLSIVQGDLDEFLVVPKQMAGLVDSAMYLELVSSYAAPTALDLDNGLQDYLWGVINTFYGHGTGVPDSYMGFEDGTFIGFVGTKTYDMVSWFREDGDDLNRSTFEVDDDGRAVGSPISTKLYDPRVRPWYTQAVSKAAGVYSSVYVFAQNGALGMTYALPVYDGNTLVGVVGIDFYISELEDLLSDFASSGEGIFIFETQADNEYDMIASSCHATLTDSSAENQLKAYNVGDYYISKISYYMQSNSITEDGSYEYNGIPFSVSNYNDYTLSWRIVSYSSTSLLGEDDDDNGRSSSSSSKDDDDQLTTVVGLTSTILVIAVVGIAISVAALVVASRKPAAPPTSDVTMSPMSKA